MRSLEIWLGQRAAAGGSRARAAGRADPAEQQFVLAVGRPDDAHCVEFLLRWVLVGWGMADLVGTVTICAMLVASQPATSSELNLAEKAAFGFAAAFYLFHLVLLVRLGLVRWLWRAGWVRRFAQPKRSDALIFAGLVPLGYVALSALFIG